VGARRFAHAAILRGDQALHALLGSSDSLPMTRSATCSAHSAWATYNACMSP
jgi:hypothetical protein